MKREMGGNVHSLTTDADLRFTLRKNIAALFFSFLSFYFLVFVTIFKKKI